MAVTREQILASLCKAYNMEIETIANYLAASLNLEGVRADFVKQALAVDVQGELETAGHEKPPEDLDGCLYLLSGRACHKTSRPVNIGACRSLWRC